MAGKTHKIYSITFILACSAVFSPSSLSPTSSPSPNMATEFLQAASQTLSTSMPLILATAWATCRIETGSHRPLTMAPFSHRSFLTLLGKAGAPPLCAALACDGLISHHGPSVSICKRCSGICLTTSTFSAVFMLQPFTPIPNPMPASLSISAAVPVKLCTNPFRGNLSRCLTSRASKSSAAARECRKSGSWTRVARASCWSK